MPGRIHLVYITPPGGLIARIFPGIPPAYRSPTSRRARAVRWPTPIHAPYSITYYLMHALSRYREVLVYDYHERAPARLKSGDIVLFHPKVDTTRLNSDGLPDRLERDSIVWQTITAKSDARRIPLMPYAPAYDDLWLDEALAHSSGEFLPICGEHWLRNWPESRNASQVQRIQRLDMAVAIKSYPHLKTKFNPSGQRRFLYIGHTAAYKNPTMLEAIAEYLPNFQGGHIGGGSLRGWKKIAEHLALTPATLTTLAEEYDIFVSVSSGDPQATTIVEQMCCGLVVACTPESGYCYPSLVPLSVNDVQHNVQSLLMLQGASQDELSWRSASNRRCAELNHSWETFTERVVAFLDLDEGPSATTDSSLKG